MGKKKPKKPEERRKKTEGRRKKCNKGALKKCTNVILELDKEKKVV